MSSKQKRNLLLVVILLVLFSIYAYRTYIAPAPSNTETLQTLLSEAPAESTEDSEPADLPAPAEADPVDDASDDGFDAPLSLLPDASEDGPDHAQAPEEPAPPAIDADGTFASRDDVALYIHTYGRLPDNFITKKEAEALGWEGGGLDDYAYGKCIGGSHYGNYEGLLPEKKGRRYTECDIDTLHRSSRGAKRIVFSNDGLIYYTGDHYDSFTLLYGEE